MNALVTQLDINAIAGRLDINQILEGVDINAVLQKVDVEALVQHTQIGAIIAHAGAGVAAEAMDAVRSVGVGVDIGVHGFVDRLLRRRGFVAGGPPLLVPAPAVA
jgi:hypothetical protein